MHIIDAPDYNKLSSENFYLCFFKVRQEEPRSDKVLLFSSSHPRQIGIKISFAYIQGHAPVNKTPAEHPVQELAVRGKHVTNSHMFDNAC